MRQAWKLGVIGTGAMGQALIKGILEAGKLSHDRLLPADADAEVLASFTHEQGLRPASNQEVASSGDVILLAVKPQQVAGVLEEIGSALTPKQLLISVAAGVPLQVLERGVTSGVPCIRAMPNTPCLVGEGAVAVSLGIHATSEHGELAWELFSTVGRCVVVPEGQMDAVTGLSGSGPAYVYLVIEALAGGGVAAGLPRDVARTLAVQTVLGAARMALNSGMHPAELRDLVTSPAGTTAAGLAVLEERALRGALQAAVQAAAARSAELGKGAATSGSGSDAAGR